MLKGQAKKDYQREYMRRKRSNKGSNTKATPERLDEEIVNGKHIDDSPEYHRAPITFPKYNYSADWK